MEAERLILAGSPYTLGLGSSGAHNTFRPLMLTICNSTFLPATQAKYDALKVRTTHLAARVPCFSWASRVGCALRNSGICGQTGSSGARQAQQRMHRLEI